MYERGNVRAGACALAEVLIVAGVASADTIPATITTGGATTGGGPWDMPSTDVTFSILRFVPSVSIDFSEFTSLSASYDSRLGGIGGGAPRFVFVANADHNGVADGSFIVH
jgi:hypothetical protein